MGRPGRAVGLLLFGRFRGRASLGSEEGRDDDRYGLDQHRAQITAEWLDTATGEVVRTGSRRLGLGS